MNNPTNVITGLFRGEPVAMAEVLRLVMAVALFIGWKVSESDVAEVLSAIGVIGSLVFTLMARRKATAADNPVVPTKIIVVEGNDPSGQPSTQTVEVPDTKPVLTAGGWRDEPAS